MTTLTSSATLTIGDGTVAVETAAVTILPAIGGTGSGSGRLVHPTLGTYDYDLAPTQWINFHGDVIIPPIWAGERTLGGAANTLWQGKLRDVVVEERWANSEITMREAQLNQLLLFWQNPPNPDIGFIEWWPSYDSTLGFKVALISVSVGGQGVQFDGGWIKAGFVVAPVSVQLRIIDRV